MDASLRGWGAVCGNPNRRPVVTTGATDAYKCNGADSEYVRSSGLCERQTRLPRSLEDGQHLSTVLRDQNGRYSLTPIDSSGMPDVGLVPPKGNDIVSFTPSGTEQCDSRL